MMQQNQAMTSQDLVKILELPQSFAEDTFL